ncbi:superoxide dismutase, Ni [Candidatus Daviesbacteria bacterium]|nr:superoxide dismutase, Ni [Candidatus Daviesbacteria bacterium]
MRLSYLLLKLIPADYAYAHCDIPCGIYDPKAAQTAAKTILKMVQKIKELPTGGTPEEILQTRNSFVRMVLVKEEHGRICKNELSILWADYFKEEHLEKFPDLHTKFWKALKLVSKNKQAIDEELAQELIKSVDEIADIFHKTQAK